MHAQICANDRFLLLYGCTILGKMLLTTGITLEWEFHLDHRVQEA